MDPDERDRTERQAPPPSTQPGVSDWTIRALHLSWPPAGVSARAASVPPPPSSRPWLAGGLDDFEGGAW